MGLAMTCVMPTALNSPNAQPAAHVKDPTVTFDQSIGLLSHPQTFGKFLWLGLEVPSPLCPSLSSPTWTTAIVSEMIFWSPLLPLRILYNTK